MDGVNHEIVGLKYHINVAEERLINKIESQYINAMEEHLTKMIESLQKPNEALHKSNYSIIFHELHICNFVHCSLNILGYDMIIVMIFTVFKVFV